MFFLEPHFSCSVWVPSETFLDVYRLSHLMFAFWRDSITFLIGLWSQPLYRRCLLKLKPHSSFMKHTRRKQKGAGSLLLMEEILHHLGCIKPCKSWDKLPTSTGLAGFLNHQQYVDDNVDLDLQRFGCSGYLFSKNHWWGESRHVVVQEAL